MKRYMQMIQTSGKKTMKKVEHLAKIVKPILKEKDLNVNDDKTEYTTIERKKMTLEEKYWRDTKKLGSLLLTQKIWKTESSYLGLQCRR